MIVLITLWSKVIFYMFICINYYNHSFLYTRCMCSKILMMIRKQSNINNLKGKFLFFFFSLTIRLWTLALKTLQERAFQTVNYRCASSTMVFPRFVRLDVYIFWNNSLTQIFLPMSMDFWLHFIQPSFIWLSVKSTVPYS